MKSTSINKEPDTKEEKSIKKLISDIHVHQWLKSDFSQRFCAIK